MFDEIDKLIDKLFGIHTTTDVNDTARSSIIDYYNYQPTTYAFLEEIFTKYPFSATDYFVDFGCGRGRVLIMASFMGCMNNVGVEINPILVEDAICNLKKWNDYCKTNGLQICNFEVINVDAMDINISPIWNKFFFFKPFSKEICIRIIIRVIESVEADNRRVMFFFLSSAKRPHQMDK